MPAPRNFRKLLGVDPDAHEFKCVGVKEGGGRCGQRMLYTDDRSRVLTKMESQTLKGSYYYLNELASLTLCPGCIRNPGYSQVALVTWCWMKKIQLLEEKEADLAMKFTMKQAIAGKAVATQEVRVAIKEEGIEKIPVTSQISQSHRLSANVKTTDLVDPFVSRNSSVHATVSESLFTQQLQELRTITSETSSHNESLHLSISNKTKVDIRSDSPTIPDRVSNLPSPPETPLALRQTASQDTYEEDQIVPVLVTESKANTAEPQETSRIFKYDHKLVDFDFQPATAPSYWPERPKATPTSRLQRREAFNSSPQHRLASLAFDSGLPPTPSVATPVPEKSSTMSNNMSKVSDSESKKESTEDVGNMAEDVPVAQSSEPVEESNDGMNSTLAPVAPGDGVASTLQGEELPQTPGQTTEEEDFGYAVITSSTSSRSYLPATYRYGLMTPPDEPDTMDTANAKSHVPAIDNDQAATPFPAVTQRGFFIIPRKPVNSIISSPSNKSPVQDAVAGREGSKEVTKEASDHAWPVNASDSYCTPLSDNEGVHVGYLGGLRMGRLREAVADRIKYMREPRRRANMQPSIAEI